jgi:hypothetical protein
MDTGKEKVADEVDQLISATEYQALVGGETTE